MQAKVLDQLDGGACPSHISLELLSDDFDIKGRRCVFTFMSNDRKYTLLLKPSEPKYRRFDTYSIEKCIPYYNPYIRKDTIGEIELIPSIDSLLQFYPFDINTFDAEHKYIHSLEGWVDTSSPSSLTPKFKYQNWFCVERLSNWRECIYYNSEQRDIKLNLHELLLTGFLVYTVFNDSEIFLVDNTVKQIGKSLKKIGNYTAS